MRWVTCEECGRKGPVDMMTEIGTDDVDGVPTATYICQACDRVVEVDRYWAEQEHEQRDRSNDA